MANEIYAHYASGSTLWSAVRNSAGQVWYPAGQVFENWGTGGRDADDYAISLTDRAGGLYTGGLDGGMPAGIYQVTIFNQAGAGPDADDQIVGCLRIFWSGTAVVTAEKMLAGRAVQVKSTGQVTYYDSDGQTVMLIHTPQDASATVTRTPA